MASKNQTVETDLLELEDDGVDKRYTYVLAVKNEKRGMTYDDKNRPRPDREYPPQRNLLMKSSIVWPKDAEDPFTPGKTRKRGKYPIRYYDGCSTLFVDDQPKDRDVIDQLVSSTVNRYFLNGYLYVYAYDEMLRTYLDWCSWNENGKYKVPTIDPIFKLLDSDAERMVEAASIDDVEKALELAKKADTKKMVIHARFLDVPMVDYVTSQKLSSSALRTEYRKAAMNDPKRFIQTYNDKSLATRFWIEKMIDSGEISTTVIPNHASWGKKGAVICDISGLKDRQFILNKLIEFAHSEEGAEFLEQLKAIND